MLLAVAALAGCATQEPKPLTSAAVQAALTVPAEDLLTAQAGTLHHQLLQPVQFNPADGLSPDEAAILAVLINPSLRAARDEQGVAAGQLVQANLLPNPQLAGSYDVLTGGPDDFNGYSVGVTWEFSSLITRQAQSAAAAAKLDSVRLDVAWQEWQVAQAAKLGLYHVAVLERQVALAQEVDQRLQEGLSLVRQAVERRLKTELDLAAAEAAAQEAHTTVLEQQRELQKARLSLNKSLGLPAEAAVRVQRLDLPSRLCLPTREQLLAGLEQRRLDLLALRSGYASQEASVRQAVLGQFPKLDLGVVRARDTSDNRTIGGEGTLDLPIFDRNQGKIAIEKATRQKLFDEYVNRVFESRAEIAALLADAEAIANEIAAAEAAVPILQRLVDTYDTAMTQGNVDVLSYYTARNDLAKKRIDLLKLKQELVDTRIALEIAAGEYLECPSATTAPTSMPDSQE